jgi:hypothetical protein
LNRSDQQDRRHQGKSDPPAAVSAARAAQSGQVRGASRGRDGQVEAIRALMVAKRTARVQQTQTINQVGPFLLKPARVSEGLHRTRASFARLQDRFP